MQNKANKGTYYKDEIGNARQNSITKGLRDFHNIIKRCLIEYCRNSRNSKTLMNFLA